MNAPAKNFGHRLPPSLSDNLLREWPKDVGPFGFGGAFFGGTLAVFAGKGGVTEVSSGLETGEVTGVLEGGVGFAFFFGAGGNLPAGRPG